MYVDIENMSDEEFEAFILNEIKYYDKPYNGLEKIANAIQQIQFENIEEQNIDDGG